jgi:DNA uptake protein ComE-like DNA-binding protein
VDEWLPGGGALPEAPATTPEEEWPSAEPPRIPETVPEAWAAERPDPELEKLRAELRRAEHRADVAENRARQLEADLRHRDEEEEATKREHTSRAEANLAAAQVAMEVPPEPPAEGERLDLNAITFEALRALGLTVSQAARFIAQRDERGGFDSIADIDELYGFSLEVRALLAENGTV